MRFLPQEIDAIQRHVAGVAPKAKVRQLDGVFGDDVLLVNGHEPALAGLRLRKLEPYLYVADANGERQSGRSVGDMLAVIDEALNRH